MAAKVPYRAFNFIVSFDGGEPVGGFADVSGLGSHFTAAGRRQDGDTNGPARKTPGVRKVGDVTLKRGVTSAAFWQWLHGTRNQGGHAPKTVSIALLDEARKPLQVWQLRNAIPLKHTGPALDAKGGDVAMEELVLSCEGIELQPT